MQEDAFYSLKGCLRVLRVLKDIKDIKVFNLLLSYAKNVSASLFLLFAHIIFNNYGLLAFILFLFSINLHVL